MSPENTARQPDRVASRAEVFQVHLAGIIDLLSHHLYSGPQVYLRELLQNAADAVQARAHLGPSPVGEINVELVPGCSDSPPTLVFEDNGIGLTEAEVHRFLATIGSSSKQGDLARHRGDFIGQFGIGLLSCFMVSDEIVLVTRSAAPGDHPALEWRGRADGTYTLRRLDHPLAQPGTRVFLRARADRREFFQVDLVRQQLQHFGGFLPHRIEYAVPGQRLLITRPPPPWGPGLTSKAQAEALDFGQELFGMRFLDCLPLRAESGDVDGIAFVLPESPSLAARRADRIYLKRMLLTPQADNLLPEWAFFVRCVVNAGKLNPSASRESLQEDAVFRAAQAELEACLRRHLMDLARMDPDRFQTLVTLHYRAIKMLAATDDAFYPLIIDWLPFETSQGRRSLGEIRTGGEVVYAPTVDTFRQVAQVAAAQSLCLVNAGYACDVDLLEKLPLVHPEVTVRRLEPDDLLENLEELSLADQDRIQEAIEAAERVFSRFGCGVTVKRFRPVDLPALYTQGESARFGRELHRTREVSTPLWSNLLGNLDHPQAPSQGHLCLNWSNPLVQRVLLLRHAIVARHAFELIYVQSLLHGHYPLNFQEQQALSRGLSGLIELAAHHPC